MFTSDKCTEVIAAMHRVQQAMEVIERKDKADAGKYSYSYASLPSIWVALKPLLKQEGLTVIQTPTGNNGQTMGDYLTTTIYHTSGEWVQDSMRLILTRDDPQAVGAAITYARRYMLTAMFGIVTDDDNDATTSRLADGSMKRDWVRAYTIMAKKQNPEATPTNLDFIKFIQEVYGKHPSKIYAKEHQQVLDTINAFNE